MAQFLARPVTTTQVIHVEDADAEAYRAQGWHAATSDEIAALHAADPYAGTQGYPAPPPLEPEPATVPEPAPPVDQSPPVEIGPLPELPAAPETSAPAPLSDQHVAGAAPVVEGL